MWLNDLYQSWLDRTAKHRPSRWPAPRRLRSSRRRRLFKPLLERLEDRSLLSAVAGVTTSLVNLGGATPLPIPGPIDYSVSPPVDYSVFPGNGAATPGGPDVHLGLAGPVDGEVPFGNEPSAITDFKGFLGSVRAIGTGTDNQGNTLYYDSDLRVMQGTYQGLDGQLHQGTFMEI